MARRCRQCGTEIRFSEQPFVQASYLERDGSPTIEALNLGEIPGLCSQFLRYAGYLWTITFEGELYRFSAASTTPEKYGDLPGNGFTWPLILEEDDEKGPLLYANNGKAIYEFRVFNQEYTEIFKIAEMTHSIQSGILKHEGNFYFLYGKNRKSPVALRYIGATEGHYDLSGLTPIESKTQPIQRVDNRVCLLTKEKLLLFADSSLSTATEVSWMPWHILPSQLGIWYSERTRAGGGGEKQVLFKLGASQVEPDRLAEEVSAAAKLAVDSDDGRLAIFKSDSISIFDFNKHATRLQPGIIDVNNPEATLLISSLLFWFEAIDRSIYLWPTLKKKVKRLFTVKEDLIFSEFFYTSGVLFGIAKDEIWRWDLFGN